MSYSLAKELKHKEYYIALLQLEIKAYKKAMETMVPGFRQMRLNARYTPLIFKDFKTKEWTMPHYTNKIEKELLDAFKDEGMVSWTELGNWITERVEQNPRMPYQHNARWWYYY